MVLFSFALACFIGAAGHSQFGVWAFSLTRTAPGRTGQVPIVRRFVRSTVLIMEGLHLEKDRTMKTKSILVVVMVAVLAITGVSQAEIIDWVTVGDAGNAADNTGYGSVGYEYQIGKYEVTNSQYCEFLNAVAVTDTYGLYITMMGGGWADRGGILRSGSQGNYTYAPKEGRENTPVIYVGWYNSLRFANWLHNGQPIGAQNSSTTEDGTYDMSLGLDVVRKAGAKVWLPSEDEWYKAAYYKSGDANAGYWEYATQNDTIPTPEAPPGGDNSANWLYSGHYAIGGKSVFTQDPYPIAAVGAYVNSTSAYGTFDQNGNVWEWNEDVISDTAVMLRGGSHEDGGSTLAASYRHDGWDESWGFPDYRVGFRIAAVPEPTSLSLLALGGLALIRRKR